jgi:hypothetical protein
MATQGEETQEFELRSSELLATSRNFVAECEEEAIYLKRKDKYNGKDIGFPLSARDDRNTSKNFGRCRPPDAPRFVEHIARCPGRSPPFSRVIRYRLTAFHLFSTGLRRLIP